MPRYFFHTTDGQSHKDEHGLELRDSREAQRIAVKMFGELVKDQAEDILDEKHFQLCLTDEQGLHLLEVMLVAGPSPAAER